MTIVNPDTGEVIDFDRASAERRAQQIETRLAAVGESFTVAMQKIREAIELRDDIALGYRSPGDYVRARFGNALSGLPVEMRREAVRELTEAGMSSRAQAPVFNVSDRMIRKDQAATTGGNPVPTSPTPAPKEGEADGAGPHVSADPADEPEGEDAPENVNLGSEQGRPQAAAPRPPVTGIDGKTYTRSESKKRAAPRRALTDQFFDAAYDAVKKVESLHRLIGDDRFPQNAEKVAAKHRNDLLRTRDLLEQVINAMPSSSTKESTP